MKRIFLAIAIAVIALHSLSQSVNRQRNTVYVLDCTGSMAGYNGSPDIWESTKVFLKTELEKESKTNPDARVTILPFQDRVLQPIDINLNHYNWANLDNTLNSYIKKLTATNICDSWIEAEKYIDQSCDNYIVLLTDGHDNIGGTANESNRRARLIEILNSFCGKYKNTRGLYVILTEAANLPNDIQEAIDGCNDLYKVDATDGIPNFGCLSEDVININTRDLPTDIPLGFSNSGTFRASLVSTDNKYVQVSIRDNEFRQGIAILHVESTFGDNIETLNKAISAPSLSLPITLQSDSVIITNPEINVVLQTKPLRSLELVDNRVNSPSIQRVKPFLWIKGNAIDTLRWNLNPVFSGEAVSDNSYALFRLKTNAVLPGYTFSFNGESLPNDSIIIIKPNNPAVIESLIPQSVEDNQLNMSLTEISSNNLDRINGVRPENFTLIINGEFNTLWSLTEILFWSVLGLFVLFLIVWFVFIRNLKYPKFKKGRIIIQSPYYASLITKGYRLVHISATQKKQSLFSKIWKGKVLYHTNPVWPYDVEISPSGKNMRFRCPSGQLISDPTPLWTRGNNYTIKNTNYANQSITINIQ